MSRRQKLRHSYPTEPGPILCWLCGVSLESGTWSTNEKPPFAYDRQEWKDAWTKHRRNRSTRNRKFALDIQASDIACAFGSPFTSALLFRVIVLSKGENQYLPPGYHLSGIGYMPGARSTNEYLLAGKDPNTACLGAGRENYWTLRISPIPHPFTNYNPKGGPLDGYVLHSRCWDLIERQVGPLAASRLDLIATALRDRWEDIISQECNGQAGSGGFYAFAIYHGLRDVDRRRDPLFIPQLDVLLQDSAHFMAKEGSGKPDYPKKLLTSKYKVPSEIMYMIAEYLSLTDTYNMLAAFGEKFPADFWKRCVPTDLIFELENADNDDASFWSYIAVEIEKRDLLDEIFGLRNRQLILHKITQLKQRILEMVNAEQCLTL